MPSQRMKSGRPPEVQKEKRRTLVFHPHGLKMETSNGPRGRKKKVLVPMARGLKEGRGDRRASQGPRPRDGLRREVLRKAPERDQEQQRLED